MNDHSKEELQGVALLAFQGRSMPEIADVVMASIPKDKHWDFWRVVCDRLYAIPIYILNVEDFRNGLTMDWSGEDYDEKYTGTDEELFSALEGIVTPDAVSETLGYCVDELKDELRKQGKIIKVESTDDVGP